MKIFTSMQGNKGVKFLQSTIFLIFIMGECLLAQGQDSIRSYELDPLVITGTRINRQKSEIPASISVISRQQIESSREINILPVLANRVPGLFVNKRNMVGYGVGPNSGGNISIRGVSGTPNTQVLMLIDGQPQFMGIFGHPIADAYTSSDIERVEVIRGPGSILYGSNALGGAINLITRQPKEGLNLYGKAAYGSYNTGIYTGSVGYQVDKFGVFGSFNREKTDGFRDDGDDEFRNTTGYLKLDYQVSKNINFSLDGNIADASYHDPGPVEGNAPADSAREYTRRRTAFSVENRYDKVEGALKFFYNNGDHAFSDGFRSNDFNYGLTFYQNLKLLKNNVITLGVDAKKFGGEPTNMNTPPGIPNGFDVEYRINETDLYALIQQNVGGNLSIDAGYRFVNNSLYGSAHVPAFGLAYQISGNTGLKASASKGFRSPAIVDLYLFPVANEELEPEDLWNYELSWNQTSSDGKFDVELTGFYIDGKNMIQAVVVTAPPPMKINTGEFQNKGIELSTDYKISESLGLLMNYTYLSTSKELLYAPDHELNLQGMYRWKPLTFMADFKYVNGLNTFIGENETTSENYVLLDLKINWQTMSWLNLFVDLNNIFDTSYQIDRGYPLPGFNVIAGLEFRYY
ncbi:MAG: TonB-dependent receptor [Cyclobacteriaceae bacterium]|nr:TonB-dependent receptor [Cyclobacteriaceae bacterium]